MQVKPGAVRAVVEFGMGVVLVPVAIVYTDKSGDGQSQFGVRTGFGSGSAQCGQ